MPLEKDNILEFNQHMKSDKIWYIIYANIESLIKKIDGCANNLEKNLQIFNTKIWAFDHIENKHILYRGEDCMKKFCESLWEHAKNITDFEKKKHYH